MTYQQEILTRAMNHIDDDLILAAHGPRKKARRIIPVAIAACLIIAFLAAFPYLRTIINTNSDILGPTADGNPENEGVITPKPEQNTYIEQNRPATLGGTTWTLTHTTETTATFTMVKTDTTPVYAMIYDRRDGVLASTEPNYKDNGVTIRPNTIRLYVNGAEQPVYQLPIAPGTYDLTIDFTSIRNGQYPMQECIGLYAYIGEDDEAMTLRFTLAVEEITTAEDVTSETTDIETTP